MAEKLACALRVGLEQLLISEATGTNLEEGIEAECRSYYRSLAGREVIKAVVLES